MSLSQPPATQRSMLHAAQCTAAGCSSQIEHSGAGEDVAADVATGARVREGAVAADAAGAVGFGVADSGAVLPNSAADSGTDSAAKGVGDSMCCCSPSLCLVCAASASVRWSSSSQRCSMHRSRLQASQRTVAVAAAHRPHTGPSSTGGTGAEAAAMLAATAEAGNDAAATAGAGVTVEGAAAADEDAAVAAMDSVGGAAPRGRR